MIRIPLLALLALAAAAIAAPGMTTGATPSPGALTGGDPLFPRLGNGGYRVGHYDLRLRYTPSTRRLRGTATITAAAVQDLSSFGLDLDGMTVSAVAVDGAPARFRRGRQKLIVTPASPLLDGQRFTVAVTYGGVPRRADDGAGETGWFVRGTVAAAVAEPDGARRWYPVDSSPSAKAPYDVTVTVPAGLTVVGNGRLVSRTTDRAAGTTTWHWQETAPMVSYAATVAIGRFALRRVRMADGTWVLTAVQQGIPEPVRRRVRTAFAQAPEILRFLSTRFGPYPFSTAGGIFGLFGFGSALETQTRPLYDISVDGELQAHELAHQWFGDSVTLTRWSDIWLNEGFATFAEWQWSHRSPTSRALLLTTYWSAWNARSRPLAGPTARTLFGHTTYVRGGTMLLGLQLLMGDRAFLAMVREWTTAHRFGNVTTDDFLALARLRGGTGAEAYLRRWLYGSKRPPLGAALTGRLQALGVKVPRR